MVAMDMVDSVDIVIHLREDLHLAHQVENLEAKVDLEVLEDTTGLEGLDPDGESMNMIQSKRNSCLCKADIDLLVKYYRN